MDMQKTYDKILCKILLNVLLNEIKVSKSNLKLLLHIYTYVRVSVCINCQFVEPLEIHQGVRQGCFASPLMFSLYMDRLGAFLESSLLGHLTTPEKCALRIIGILLLNLLFENGIVFLSTQNLLAQHILNTLADFCA